MKHIDEIFKELRNVGKDYNNRCKIDPSDYFDNMPKVKVIENYPDACEELEGLFANATECLIMKMKKLQIIKQNFTKLLISFLTE